MKRKARIYLRALPQEKREFKKKAKSENITLSEWLLKAALEKITLPVENKHE